MQALDPSVRIAFLGAGNMAEAIVQGMVRAKACQPNQIVVTDIQADRVQALQQSFGVDGTMDGANAISRANVIVLAVKPQGLADAVRSVTSAVSPDALIVSIAAGIALNTLENLFATGQRVIRVMPNTPCLVQAGASAISAGTHATEADMRLAEICLGATGLVLRVPEEQLDAVTALSGSGPAYYFYFIEHMLRAANELGLGEADARALAVATMRGAATLLAESAEPPQALREKVTSKGGTTAAALQVLEQAGVGESIRGALRAASDRSRELSAS